MADHPVPAPGGPPVPPGLPPDLPLVSATGTPAELGRAHGAALRGRLAAFLDDGLARVSALSPAPVTLEELRPELAAYDAAISDATPALAAEIGGLAEGARIPRELAVLLQVRREIIGYQRIPSAGDCTTWASLTAGPGGQPVLAQTVDLAGNLDDQIAVLDLGPDPGRRTVGLSFGGLLGYLGVNSDGLAIGLNLVLAGDWHPGLPPYLAIRHLLDRAGSVAEALAILPRLPLASSRSLTLCDPGAVACVELARGQIREVDPAVHTNHFLHPDFSAGDELNVFARNSSRLRLAAGQAALAALTAMPGGAGAEDHLDALSRPPVNVPGRDDIRRERTVAAIVALPALGELHVRPGDPAAGPTRVFRARQEARL